MLTAHYKSDILSVPPTQKDFIMEAFVAKARLVHGDRYDYSKVVYINSQTKVWIGCPQHGFLEQKPNNHLTQGGCRKCGIESKVLTQAQFIEKANKTHNSKYSYENAVYVGGKGLKKILVNCPVHGEFSIGSSSHLHGKGCRKCASNAPLTTQQFVDKANAVHGSRYSYSRSVYTTSSSPITVTCNTHGDWDSNASSHLCGRGCPLCASYGYKENLPGNLYILKYCNITKIGITNRAVKARLREINKASGKKFEAVLFIAFESGKVASDIETRLLGEMKKKYQQPSENYDGATESFFDVPQDSLHLKITELCSEFLPTK